MSEVYGVVVVVGAAAVFAGAAPSVTAAVAMVATVPAVKNSSPIAIGAGVSRGTFRSPPFRILFMGQSAQKTKVNREPNHPCTFDFLFFILFIFSIKSSRMAFTWTRGIPAG